MPSLPVVELSSDRHLQSRIAPWVHAGRLILVVLLVVGLHRWGRIQAAVVRPAQTQAIDITAMRAFLPENASFEPLDYDQTVVRVVDSTGQALEFAAQTLPHAERIVGYAGPSNLAIVMDDQWQVTAIHLLHCPDTTEHVRKVMSRRAFWQQFVGWKWGETAAVRVDGVSGATLTSLAIAEAVAWRMATAGMPSAGPPPLRPSARFAGPVDVERIRKWYPDADVAREDPDAIYQVDILDEQGHPLGKLLRTGPLSDTVIGYQGPSEVLLTQAEDGLVTDLMLGESFDNQPYVNYVKQEASFWRKFRGRSLESLAKLDLDEEMIDGVSGATMTSLAVAETIREAAANLLEHQQQIAAAAVDLSTENVEQRTLRWNWSLTERLTAGLALTVLFWSRSRFRGRRLPRLLWQAASLLLLGLVCGNLLSIALLGGWSRGGVPWRLAPGLVTLVAVSLLAAAVSKGNVYCDHLCPHGILQQWIRPRRARRLGRPIEQMLRLSALGVIAVMLVGIVTPLSINLAWLEPFDAYAVRVGVSFSLVLWGASLLLARLQPMAYCRHACPTGKLLDYVRRDASRHRMTLVDFALLAGVVATWVGPSIGLS